MVKLAIILGDTLFENIDELKDADIFFMKESKDLANHFLYHKKKIMLFFASMRHYKDELTSKIDANKKIIYQRYDGSDYFESLIEIIKRESVKKILTYEIKDQFFRKQIQDFCKRNKIELQIFHNKNFISTTKEFETWRNENKLFMHSYYINQRKKLGILMNGQKPLGEKWSFDADNRKPFPKQIKIPKLPTFQKTKHLSEVENLVNDKFSQNPGTTTDFIYPITREQANHWLEDFINNRLENFGTYEDAISSDIDFGFHSILTPSLNIGLLNPLDIVKKVERSNAPLNSKEGFIRQIIGWREFVKGTYETENLTTNYFNHKRKLPQSFYNATTGIEPLDNTIKKTLKHGYNHHIERLMILSNFMLLLNIDPDEVYKWFMEMYVDSADWVMIPNVYAMGQFASDAFATKPYISSSNYVLKMSDYSRGEWCDIWDALYWKFINDKKDFFKKNPRMRMMVKMYEKKSDEKKKYLMNTANKYLENLI